jgi:UPF0176 protein
MSTHTTQLWHSSFYKFAHLPKPYDVSAWLKELCAPITGSILLATEGINGMVAGTAEQVDAFEAALVTEFDGVFAGTQFKRTECVTVPFKHMKIQVKREIVPLGVDGIDAINHTPKALNAQQWRELIVREDVVLLDNRNSFEFKLGHFKGAVDPGVQHFRDFPRYIQENVGQWKEQGKKVAMYCTGGIRCEKTSAWMRDMGVDVFELKGGILTYLKEMPDAEQDWQGECFVFDSRVALDAKLHETQTTPEEVYKDEPDAVWRLNRARRLDGK